MLKNPYPILYDIRDKRRFWRIALGITGLWILTIAVGISKIFDSIWPDVTAYAYLGICFLFFLTVGAWIGYLDVVLYLKRLRKHGYEVPEDKRKFFGSLEHLPQSGPSVQGTVSKESILLAFLFFLCGMGIAVRMAGFYVKYEPVSLGWVGLWESPLFVIGMVCSVQLWRQRLNAVFRDDVEIDKGRRVRRHFTGILSGILVYLAVAVLWTAALETCADYMYQARLAAGYYG